MKKLLCASAAALSLLAAPTVSHAQDDVVLGDEIVTPKNPGKPKDLWIYADANIGYSQFSSTEGNTTFVSDSMANAYFRAGVKYKYFGAEVELGTGLSDIDEDGLSLGLGTQISGFGILRYPADKYDVFLRAGYHSSDFDVEFEGFDPDFGDVNFDESISSDGFAFGIGGTYYFSENFGLRADITGYNTRDIADAGYVGGSIGGTVKF